MYIIAMEVEEARMVLTHCYVCKLALNIYKRILLFVRIECTI